MENVGSVISRNNTDKCTTEKTKFTLPPDNDTIVDLDECDEALRRPIKMLRSPFQEKERQEPECAKDNENKSITGSSNLNKTQKASVALHQVIKSPAANSTFWHESDNNTTTSPYFGDQPSRPVLCEQPSNGSDDIIKPTNVVAMPEHPANIRPRAAFIMPMFGSPVETAATHEGISLALRPGILPVNSMSDTHTPLDRAMTPSSALGAPITPSNSTDVNSSQDSFKTCREHFDSPAIRSTDLSKPHKPHRPIATGSPITSRIRPYKPTRAIAIVDPATAKTAADDKESGV